MSSLVNMPEPRKAIVYTRVKEINKLWLENAARKQGISESSFLDYVLDNLRAKGQSPNAGKKKSIKRSNS